jgi:hypothetical protein
LKFTQTFPVCVKLKEFYVYLQNKIIGYEIFMSLKINTPTAMNSLNIFAGKNIQYGKGNGIPTDSGNRLRLGCA